MSSPTKIVINEALTLKTADLARLDLTQQQVKDFTLQLASVMEHIEAIQEVDVHGVEPLVTPIEHELGMREDRAENDSEEILKSAPDVLYDGYKVPPIL